MSDLNNIRELKTLSFIDLIINIWKFKLFFFYILIPLIFLSILIEHLVPKKILLEIQFKDENRIKSDFIPTKFLTQFVQPDIPTLYLSKIYMSTDRLELDFFRSYFLDNFLSSKNINDFAKMSNKSYNLQEYISNNSITVAEYTKANRPNNYALILPNNDKYKNFLNEYFIYTLDLSVKLFENEVIKYAKKKIDLMEKDLVIIDKIAEGFVLTSKDINEYVDDILVKENILKIKNLYKARKINIDENISFLKSSIEDDEKYTNWIVDGPKDTIINYKAYKIISYITPVILSLILYLLFVLIRLQKQDKQI